MEAKETVYCKNHNFLVALRDGIAYDEDGQRRDDVREDTCFSCGKSFLVSDSEDYPRDCPHCNAVL
jgi:hypothetical protein